MDKLIPIHEGQFPVNARDLHEFLQSGDRFSDWIKNRIDQYGFRLGEDYEVFRETPKNPVAGRPSVEYSITLSMAKELSMVERNERGKQARRYFIACEEKLKAIIAQPRLPASYAEALRELADTVEQKALLEAKIETDRPKVEFAERVRNAEGCQNMNQVAKALGWGEIRLFAHLRQRGILMSNNMPLQRYIDRGYFAVVENVIHMGDGDVIRPQTLVTPQGLIWLQKVVPPYVANKKAHMSGKLPEIRHA